MATIGDAAQSRGDIMRRLADLERRMREQAASRKLENSSVGTGGIRIHGGGNLRIHDGGSVTLEDGGSVNVTDGGDVRLVGGGKLEMLVGDLPGEMPGELRPFISGDGRAAVRLRPSHTRPDSENFLMIEGRTDTAPNGGAFLRSAGNTYISSGNGSYISSGNGSFLNLLSDTTLESGGYLTLNGGSGTSINAGGQLVASTPTGHHLYISSGNQVVVSSPGTISLNADNNIVEIAHRTGAFSANVSMNTNGALYRDTSSARYKQDIADASIDAGAVLRLRPRTWRQKDKVAELGDDAPTHTGLVAEEVEAAGLGCFVVYDDKGRPDGIDHGRLSVAAISVVQKQQKQIDALAARIEQLEQRGSNE